MIGIIKRAEWISIQPDRAIYPAKLSADHLVSGRNRLIPHRSSRPDFRIQIELRKHGIARCLRDSSNHFLGKRLQEIDILFQFLPDRKSTRLNYSHVATSYAVF